MRLFAYKMTHDSGFAPNPFWGYLTLATCKPKMRAHKHPGDWIAGFTSKTLCGDWVGDERLVFLMKVEEKVALADYFEDPRFESRIPRQSPAANVYRCGDNIYRPLVPNARDARDFEQVPNNHHGPGEKDHDLSGRHALIARRFAYFGAEALRVPRDVRPNVPTGQSAHGTETRDRTRAQQGRVQAPALPTSPKIPPGTTRRRRVAGGQVSGRHPGVLPGALRALGGALPVQEAGPQLLLQAFPAAQRHQQRADRMRVRPGPDAVGPVDRVADGGRLRRAENGHRVQGVAQESRRDAPRGLRQTRACMDRAWRRKDPGHLRPHRGAGLGPEAYRREETGDDAAITVWGM